MNEQDLHAAVAIPIQTALETSVPDALQTLLTARSVAARAEQPPSVTVGELVGLSDDGETPLVIYPSQPGSAALRARSVLDLHGVHVGRAVVLMFENDDASRPIVMGVLRALGGVTSAEVENQVEVDTDGQRMFVTAKEQLVLRCGEASITLTKAGKVLIQGRYISSRSSGVNRIKGGSVQLN